MFVCITCNFTAKDSNNLKEHLRTNHTAKNVKEIPEKKNEKQTKTQYCHYWNNYGNCNFELKNGRPCKFEHKQAPRCKFDGQCDRKCCLFSHYNQNMSFLANAPMRSQPQLHQWGTRQGRNQRNNQNQEGGPRRWGNARQF